MRRPLHWMLVAVIALVPAAARAQQNEVRFAITAVGDSTVTFGTAGSGWVAAGQTGIVIDPRRSDALVARFRILRVRGGRAEALITAEAAQLEVGQSAILTRPPVSFYRGRDFWLGVLLGAAGGVLIGAAF